VRNEWTVECIVNLQDRCVTAAHATRETSPAASAPAPTQGFAIGTTTVFRYIREALDVLAALAPTLRDAVTVWFLAACIAEFSDACGGVRDEWGTLTEKEQMAPFNFFAVHESLPFAELGYTEETTRDALPAAAREFRETIGIGKLRATAAKITAGL
jgi:hypothetical protein